MGDINFSNVSINYKKICEIKENPTTSKFIKFFERILIALGFKQDAMVANLLTDTFFNENTSNVNRIKGFFQLRKMAGSAFSENFEIKNVDKHIEFSIKFRDAEGKEKISLLYSENDIENKNIYELSNLLFLFEEYDINYLHNDIIKKFIYEIENGSDIQTTKEHVVFDIIKENIDKFKTRRDFNKEYILKNSLNKEVFFDIEEFLNEVKNKEGKNKDGVKNDIKRQKLLIDKKLMALQSNAVNNSDEKSNLVNSLDEKNNSYTECHDFDVLQGIIDNENIKEDDQELIYSLLYQKTILSIYPFLVNQDLFSGMVNTTKKERLSIIITKDKNKIKFKTEQYKKLTADNAVQSELDYLSENQYKLVNIIASALMEKPFSILDYIDLINRQDSISDNQEVQSLLEVNKSYALGSEIALLFEYDTEIGELTIDNTTHYKYTLLKY